MSLEQKNNIENENNVKNNNKKNEENINELKQKIIILKNGVIDERKKSNKLEKTISELNEQIFEKDQIITKLQLDLNILNNNLNSQDPKTYFDNLINAPIDNEANLKEIEELKKENNELKNEINGYIEQNQYLTKQFENLTIEFDMYKKDNEINIENLKKQNLILQNNFNDKEKIFEAMNKSYNKLNEKQDEINNKINKLSIENKKLKDENNNLTNQNKTYLMAINSLSEQIKNKSELNYLLEEKLKEEKEIVKETYVFKGKIYYAYGDIYRKNIKIFFGKFEDKIIINNEDDDNIEKEIDISDIKVLKSYQNSLTNLQLEYTDFIDGKDKNLICIFTKKECEYILKFYNEMKEKNESKNHNIVMTTMNLENYSY
jgi:chromosome segregation ATPase